MLKITIGMLILCKALSTAIGQSPDRRYPIMPVYSAPNIKAPTALPPKNRIRRAIRLVCMVRKRPSP